MPSCFGVKEREFINDLREWNIRKMEKKYSASYRRVLKYRLLQKRRNLTNDLLMINSILDKLQLF
ncbi:MAG: hypothetical protein E6K94_03725 [Thaumarchaeota archaeon]|nr:MAG: hypothetical protein E6L03_09060 [Nitrososphaerota archaeon]TLX91505.1 MAG: hypothetical protein E6K94_03725 [Nitrososphaerota archaeon]